MYASASRDVAVKLARTKKRPRGGAPPDESRAAEREAAWLKRCNGFGVGPALLAVEGRGKEAALASKMTEALLHAHTAEYSKIRQPKYLERDLAKDIVDFLRSRNWRGHLSGMGHSKKRPLLTRLVGGIKMWRGEREFKESEPAAAPTREADKPPAAEEPTQPTATVVSFADPPRPTAA